MGPGAGFGLESADPAGIVTGNRCSIEIGITSNRSRDIIESSHLQRVRASACPDKVELELKSSREQLPLVSHSHQTNCVNESVLHALQNPAVPFALA